MVGKNDRLADWPIDDIILQDARDAIAESRPLVLDYTIENTNRTVGGRIAGEIAYRYGDKGLADDTLTLRFTGSAGQSFGAFNIGGMRLQLTGEACDYVGKSMHGGTIVVRPQDDEKFVWSENVIVGNVVMYGATGGRLFIAGQAGERFCVRNSGGTAVVEGIGDHGCEYMTGGVVVVLGETGLNFGAGMSGGMAYIYDKGETLERRYNPDMVGIERVSKDEDKTQLKALIEAHAKETTSPHAQAIVDDWENAVSQFYKVVPHPEKAPAPKVEKPKRTPRALKPGALNDGVAVNGKPKNADPNAIATRHALGEDGAANADELMALKSPEELANEGPSEQSPVPDGSATGLNILSMKNAPASTCRGVFNSYFVTPDLSSSKLRL